MLSKVSTGVRGRLCGTHPFIHSVGLVVARDVVSSEQEVVSTNLVPKKSSLGGKEQHLAGPRGDSRNLLRTGLERLPAPSSWEQN